MERDLFNLDDDFIYLREEDNYLVYNNLPQAWENVAQAHLEFFRNNDFNQE